MKYFLSTIALLGGLFSLHLQGQQLLQSTDIPVYDENGRQMAFPWTGGVNEPEFSNIDLNLDGKMDLVIADDGAERQHMSFIPLIATGNPGEISFRYAPEYERVFQDCNCQEIALFRDYNNDGIQDLFCGRFKGNNFRLYKGIQACKDSLEFELISDFLMATNPSTKNLKAVFQERPDIPAIVDVDFDGDLDIVATQNGFNRFTYYRNQGVEYLGRTDTLYLEEYHFCWGHFNEFVSNDSLFLADTTGFCELIEGRSDGTRHSGTTLTLFDYNADSLIDVLIGDVDTYTSNLAINGGSQEEAIMVDAIYKYPDTDTSIWVSKFVANFYVDVNQDGVRDLVSTPNGDNIDEIETVNGVALFLNKGLDNDVDFDFQGRTFFVQDHIDAGSFSRPAFVDENNDGLLDILVGNLSATYILGNTVRSQTEFHLYRNIGSPTQPAFQLITRDYMNISQQVPFITAIYPTFGDLDNDDDLDMLLGSGDGRIFQYENVAGANQPANWQLVTGTYLLDENFIPIFLFSNASPELADIDGDGDLDLLIGGNRGKFTYYRNDGTASSPSFHFVTDKFGEVLIFDSVGDSLAAARPRIIDMDADGDKDLVVGGENGFLEVYKDVALGQVQALTDVDTLLDRRIRSNLAPAAAYLGGNTLPTLVLGNEEGGLVLIEPRDEYRFCSTDITDTTTVDTTGSDTTVSSLYPPFSEKWVSVFPNPAVDFLTVEFDKAIPNRNSRIAIMFNSLGQVVETRSMNEDYFRWNISEYPEGIYYLKIRSETRQKLEKLIIQR